MSKCGGTEGNLFHEITRTISKQDGNASKDNILYNTKPGMLGEPEKCPILENSWHKEYFTYI